MAFQHTVLAAEVASTETAVADNGLCSVFAVLKVALDLLGRATTERKSEVNSGLGADRVI